MRTPFITPRDQVLGCRRPQSAARAATIALAILAQPLAFAPPAAAALGASAAASSQETVRHVSAGEVRYAFREYGPRTGVPLLLVNRFRGTLDDWDPALISALAAKRRVVTFDNAGDSRSTGRPGDDFDTDAESCAAFIRAMGWRQVDILGFSLGGQVAMRVALAHPDTVRRLVLASSTPGGVPGGSTAPATFAVAAKPVNSDADLLFLFFRDTPTSQAAGRAYLARAHRAHPGTPVPVSAEAWHAMAAAVGKSSAPQGSLIPRLGRISQPTLVAGGSSDIMLPPANSLALAQGLPNARLVLYPDSGHAFLFQHHQAFAREVLAFLD